MSQPAPQAGGEEAVTPADNPVSVYYPFALVEFLEVRETDDPGAADELLLAFRDEDGCRVTLRVRRSALQAMHAALSGAPP